MSRQTTEQKLAHALRAYVLTLDYMQRRVNPEHWETTGNWRKLAEDAQAALTEHDSQTNGTF